MAFRNDRQALAERADALETDLVEANRLLADVREQLVAEAKAGDDAEQRLRELAAQVNDLRKELGRQPLPLAREKKDPMGRVAIVGLLTLVAFALVAVGGVLMLATTDLGDEPPAFLPLVFGGFFMAFGLPMVWMGLATFAKDREIAKWPRVAGTILSARVESYTYSMKDQYGYYRSHEAFHPDVTYRYSVDGTEYVGSGVARAGLSTSDRAAVQACVDRYPPEAKVMLMVDPDDPAVAYLEVRSSVGAWIILLFGLLLIGIGGIVASIYFGS